MAGSVAIRAVTVALWLVASGAILMFLFATAVRPTSWWENDKALASAKNKTTINILQPHPVQHLEEDELVPLSQGGQDGSMTCPDFMIWDGDQGFTAALQWGCVLVACLAAAGLKAIKIHERHRLYEAQVADPHVSRWDKVSLQVHHILSYQLPPRKLWNDMVGGMSVLDAILVSGWLGFTAIYLWACTTRKYQQVDEKGLTGDARSWMRLIASGEASGTVLLFLCMVLFFPVSRSTLLKTLFGSSFQALIKYHRWMAWGTVWISFGHSCIFMLAWGAEGSLSKNLNLRSQETTKNVMGTVSMLLFLVIAATANSWFRSNYFKIFYPVHITCFFIFITFAIFHSPYMAYWLLPSLVLYAMDRAFRYWQMASNWTQLSPIDFNSDGNMMTLRLRWNKAAESVNPGQTVYLRVPAMSLFYTHPFSVADVADEGNALSVVLHVRQVANWTKSLKDRLSNGESLKVQVEGPYESKLDYLHGAPVVVMVAGGTGVTPVLAVLRRFARMALSGKGKVPQTYFVWTSRSLAELRLMGAPLLAAAASYNTKSMYPAGPNSSDDEAYMDTDAAKPTRWLHADIHYTGQDTEPKPTGLIPTALEIPLVSKNSETKIISPRTPRAARAAKALSQTLSSRLGKAPVIYPDMDPESLAAIPEPVKRQVAAVPLLSPHPSSQPLRAAGSLVLTFACAWLGFLAGNAFISFGMSRVSCGYNFLLQSLVQFVCILVSAIAPTFLLQCVTQALSRTPNTALVTTNSVSIGVDEDYLSTSLVVAPGLVLQGKDTDVGSLKLQRGRPKLQALLQRVREQHPLVGQVDVIVAGPDGLCQTVHELCLHPPGKSEGPALVFRRAAYHT